MLSYQFTIANERILSMRSIIVSSISDAFSGSFFRIILLLTAGELINEAVQGSLNSFHVTSLIIGTLGEYII